MTLSECMGVSSPTSITFSSFVSNLLATLLSIISDGGMKMTRETNKFKLVMILLLMHTKKCKLSSMILVCIYWSNQYNFTYVILPGTVPVEQRYFVYHRYKYCWYVARCSDLHSPCPRTAVQVHHSVVVLRSTGVYFVGKNSLLPVVLVCTLPS